MLKRLDALIDPLRKHASFADVPVRYSVLTLCIFGLLLSAFSLVGFGVGWLAFVVSAVLVGVGVHDLRQTRHAITAGLIADSVAVIASVTICHALFG